MFARILAVLILLAACVGVSLQAQNTTPVNVPAWRYDNLHQGQNTQETALTPANVNSTSFGKLFTLSVDGYVYAQPLYMSGLTMGDGLVHNVLFVATEHDSVYAFDADSNGGTASTPLWHASLLTAAYGAAAGATTLSSSVLGINDIIPEVGITSTPVINPATQTLYVVSKTYEKNVYVQRLHALNMITGAEQPNSPMSITGSVPGTGNGSSGGTLAFSTFYQLNRPALSYYNGYIYISFGSHGDGGPWHGWVFAYNASTLAQTAVLCVSANGAGDGIWSSGAASPIDTGGTAGRMYFVTGNGTASTYPPIAANTPFGNSIVRLDLANGGLTATDAFTPYNQAALTSSDTDQGSGGILMLPDQQGANPHILIQIGKNGTIEVVNRDNMGGYAAGASANTNILQDITGQTKGLWGTPAYWNNNVYTWGSNDRLKLFQLNSGVLTPTAASIGTVQSSFPGPTPVVSANGTQNGIVWAAKTDAYTNNGSEVLYAFNATNLTNILYESDSNARDDAGPANKFVVPVVTNGKVYLGAAYQVDVYGLLNGVSATANPAISPATGTYPATVTVTITSATPNAYIYYTLDGSVPSTASTLYTGPFPVASTATVRAVASAQGYIQSGFTSASYTLPGQTPPVAVSPTGGTYNGTQNVTLADADAAAAIYYTLDGSTPTSASTLYTGPVAVTASATLKAIAQDSPAPVSNVTSNTYSIGSAGSVINFGSGFSSVAGMTLNGSAVNSDDSRLQLTTGVGGQAGSAFWNTPVNIQAFTNTFSFELSNAVADGFTFTLQNVGPTALGGSGSNLGYGGMAQSAAIKFDFYSNAGEGADSTGLYTNGATPTVPATDITSSGIKLNSGDPIQAQLVYNGTVLTLTLTDVIVNKTYTQQFTVNLPQVLGSSNAYVGFTGGTGGKSASQKILSWNYSSAAPTPTAAAPVFSPAGGSFTATQSVSLGSTTAGAAIYYTTNGTTPTTASTLYSGPITAGAGTTTINAIATATGLGSSAVSTATYVVSTPATAAPVFTPAGGNYAAAQSVSIADSTANAVLYYTTNGTTPTTASAVYSGPIAAPAGTTNLKAIALAPGFSQSAVSTATYVVASSFTLSAASASLTIAPGQVASDLVSVVPGTGFTGTVTFSVSGLPAGASSTFTPAASTTGSTIAISTLSTIAAGTYPVTVKGVSGTAAASATITVIVPGTTPVPVFSPAGGTYTTAQQVSIADADSLASIYYTTDGSTPTTASTPYSGAIAVSTSRTLKAIAVDGATPVSGVATGSYVISAAVPVINYPAGFASTSAFTLNGSMAGPNNTLQLTSATGGSQQTSVFYNTPVNIQSFATTFNFQLVNAVADGFTFTLQNTGQYGNYTVGGNGSSLGYGGIGSSAAVKFDFYNNAGEGANSTGLYTNGATPTVPAVDLTSSGIVLNSGDTIQAQLSYNGSTLTLFLTDLVTNKTFTTSFAVNLPQLVGGNTAFAGFTAGTGGAAATQNILNWTYTVTTASQAAAAPVFSPAAGTYTTAQPVALTSATAGSSIYYTTNGTVPTTASTLYTAPVSIASTTTLNAIAVAPGVTQSTVSTAVYTISLPATPIPVFTPAGGSYSAAQSVSIADSATGAVIHYTTNGSTPTTASATYSGPITAPAGTTAIKAIAVAPGSSQSAVTTATYVVTVPVTPTPAYNPAAGSYAAPQSVTLTDAAAGAVIYYTTNGTTPTTASAVYSGAIAVGNGTTTIQALATVAGSSQSKVATATYTIAVPATAAPTFSPVPGSYTVAQSVTLADATTGAAIYYTTNGTTPTTGSTLYTTAIPVAATATIQAIAVAAGGQTSAVATGLYTIQAAATGVPNYPAGFTSPNGLAINGNAALVPQGNLLQLISNTYTSEVGSAWYSTPVNINSFTTDFTFQLLNAVADGLTFTVQGQGVTALGPGGSGLGYGAGSPGGTGGIPNSFAIKFDVYSNQGEGSDSTGTYQNGASPTIPSTDLTSSGIVLNSGHIFHEHIVYNGTSAVCTLTDTSTSATFTATYPVSLSSLVGGPTAYVGFTAGEGGATMNANILTWTFSNTVTQVKGNAISQVAREPAMMPAPGSFRKTTLVTLKPEAPGSVIHYTVDGSQPSASSPVYKAPIVVLGRSLTIKSYSVTPGKKDSPVVTGTYYAH